MAINNKPLGSSANPVNVTAGESVLPKLINHNTPEEDFQEGMDDVARQVNQTQIDLGYPVALPTGNDADNPDMGGTGRAGAVAAATDRTVAERLTTIEEDLSINATGSQTGVTPTLTIGQNSDTDVRGSLDDLQLTTDAVETDNITNGAVTSAKLVMVRL